MPSTEIILDWYTRLSRIASLSGFPASIMVGRSDCGDPALWDTLVKVSPHDVGRDAGITPICICHDIQLSGGVS